MSYSSSTTYNFTAFTEADLLAGTGDGNLGYGDTFTMPGCASVEFSVTDNDDRLSGDSRWNENANDKSGQTASIMQDGQEVGNGGQIYAEGYFWVSDQHGNWYLLIEIEQEGGCDDYFAFHECYGVPPAGAELTVSCGGNINCWEPKFDDLTAGEVKVGPEAVNDVIEINEDETIGDAGDDAQLNILANDSEATLRLVNGLPSGADLTVDTVGGVSVTVSVDADGDLTFDTAGLFDDLNDGDSDRFTISYTIEDTNGKTAEASATIIINGETDPVAAVDDLFVVLETEGAGEPGGEGNVLANDGLPGDPMVIEVNGVAANVGEWVPVDGGGRFRLNEDGEFDFDANGAYDDLFRGESVFETLDYTVRTIDPAKEKVVTTFTGPDGLEAEVVVRAVDGELVVTVTVLENGGDIADIRGLFFDVTDESLLSGLDATGDDVTRDKFYADRVDNLGHGANVRGSVIHEYGKFDGGVRIGTSGIGKDDVRSTTFTLSHATEDLTLDLLSGQDMGLRLTSVGQEGGHRDDSLKLGAVSTFMPAPVEIATATVTVEIVGANEPPTAEENFYAFLEDAAPSTLGNVILDPGGDAGAVDSDPENDVLSVISLKVGDDVFLPGDTFNVTSTGLMQEVAVTVGSDGSLFFDDLGNFDALNSGETDIVTFEYTISDGNGGEDSANVTVTIVGEDDEPPQVEYNILFLVDASSGLDDGDPHGLFLFTPPADLNGDGNVNTVLDAELSTVQQFVDTLGGLSDFSTDVEIGVQTFTSNSNLRTPNDQNVTLQDNAGNSIFTSGDDLSEAFAGAGGDDGVAIWNTAIAGANDFFDFNNNGSSDVVNLLYILSDSEGTQQTVFPEDQPLATELLELQTEHDVTIDTIIYNDTDTPNQFLVPIEASGGDGMINLVENQFDLNALLGTPLQENLELI